jgi:chemotaxis protein MotB
MNRIKFGMIGTGMVVLLASCVGCVSRDEYLRTKFSNDTASSRASGLENELADERSKNNELRNQVETLQREKETLSALADNLKAENSRLNATNRDLLAKMDEMLRKGIPNAIDVVEVKLPPELDRALQDFAARYPQAVEYDSKRGLVRWKSDLTFALGSDQLRDDAKAALSEFARIVQSSAASGFEVVIAGHTDNVPIRSSAARFPSNWHLSCYRAIAVMNALHEYGCDYTRMGCLGYGEWRPREPNPARGGNERNRRVEVFLVSSKSPIPSSPGGSDAMVNDAPSASPKPGTHQ